MKSKLITLTHHMDDYECMWNGIEDLYIQSTGEKLPPSFFFVLASFGSFCYMRTPKAELKRMIAFGDGHTKQMYQFLAPIVGFEFKHFEYKTFDQAMQKAKSEIDSGHPPVLGALDMYYLSYYSKLYHGEHIPFHYVMMTGYDDEAQHVYLLDCGREAVQTLSFEELRLAWACSYPGLSKPNTVCTVRMNSTKNKYQIAKEALAKKADLFLNPPVGFTGRKGLKKFIQELPLFKNELSKEDYDRLLTNLVMFFGTVPTLPNALRGINEPDELSFYGGFDKMSRVLGVLGEEYDDKNWLKASEHYTAGADIIAEVTKIIVDYLTGKADRTDELPGLFTQILNIMIVGFELIG